MIANETPRPVPLEVVVGGIPEELKALPQWVGWRYEHGERRWTKVPIDCRTGRKASTIEPATWSSFGATLKFHRERGLDGLGFVFSEDDPHAGIDLDGCRDPATGRLEPWAEEIVADLDSYAEVSPSGTGVKVFVRADLPGGLGRRKGGIEVYSRRHYFAVTGRRLDGSPAGIEARQEAVEGIYGRLRPESGQGGRQVAGGPSQGLTDDQVIARAGRARNGGKFTRLWAGDTAEYDSDSEADLALCGILAFWVGADPERVERLFGRSTLGEREKWSERPDYREKTIRQAMAGRGAVLTRGTKINMKPKIDRTTQDSSGDVSTQACEATASHEGFGLRGPSPGPPDVVRGAEGGGQGGQVAIDLAIALAEDRGQAPIWQTSFELARRLRTLAKDGPERFEAAARAFCDRAGQPSEEFWYAFLDSWEKVRVAEGDDVLGWAAGQAEKAPFPVAPCPGPRYGIVASIAFHLARHTAPDPFLLPRERLGAVLGTNAMDASRIVNLLVTNGVIECVNDSYSYAEGTAKEYRFIHAGPLSEDISTHARAATNPLPPPGGRPRADD